MLNISTFVSLRFRKVQDKHFYLTSDEEENYRTSLILEISVYLRVPRSTAWWHGIFLGIDVFDKATCLDNMGSYCGSTISSGTMASY